MEIHAGGNEHGVVKMRAVAAGGAHSVVFTRKGYVWTWGHSWPPAFHYLALEEDGRLLAQPLIMSQSKASTISIRFHDVIKKRKCTTSAIHVRMFVTHIERNVGELRIQI
ncbi:hypothetical protein YC2023_074457 [Brassica napus]